MTPVKGFLSRRQCDGIFFTSAQHQALYLEKGLLLPGQQTAVGHPYFLGPEPFRKDTGGPVYFFAQAISPPSLRAREHIVEVLSALARRYPERKVVLKLRHLPEENRLHVHKERYPYGDLLRDAPANLHLSACSMEEALADAAVAITCTSTAAMDAVSAGVPTMVYLDYVERYLDPLVVPMAKEFSGSGLIRGLEDILRLRASPPKPAWLAQRFVTERHIVETLTAMVERSRATA